jgi:hypothetical protein
MKSVHGSFRTTLDLFSTGVELMRQNLRRDRPQASEDEIDRRLSEWLQERPGAVSGDSPGRLVDIDARLG